jgi:hypothetical protein
MTGGRAIAVIDEIFHGYLAAQSRILRRRAQERAGRIRQSQGDQRRPHTMTTQLTSTQANALSIIDGFDEGHDPTASPLRGTSIRFKDGDYLAFSDPIDVRDRSFVVLDRFEGCQKLAKDCPPEYLMRVRGEPRPPRPHVDESDWPPNLNGTPEHPWKLTLYLYLLDVDTGEISTFWTNTVGGKVAIGQLADQVAFMRQARPDALPVVALESRDMPTQFGGTKPRPHFRILGYKSRGNVGAQNLLSGSEQNVALPDVEAPSIAEQLNDDLPDNLK